MADFRIDQLTGVVNSTANQASAARSLAGVVNTTEVLPGSVTFLRGDAAKTASSAQKILAGEAQAADEALVVAEDALAKSKLAKVSKAPGKLAKTAKGLSIVGNVFGGYVEATDGSPR